MVIVLEICQIIPVVERYGFGDTFKSTYEAIPYIRIMRGPIVTSNFEIAIIKVAPLKVISMYCLKRQPSK